MYQVFDDYESSLANKFDINAEEGVKYDVATEKDTSAQLFSMLLPMLLMSFLFSGCMAVAPESIVGEKERGTIATLLVTPMKRSELAVGKVLSLSVIGLLGGVSCFIGTMLALPNLMGGAALEDDSMTTIIRGETIVPASLTLFARPDIREIAPIITRTVLKMTNNNST